MVLPQDPSTHAHVVAPRGTKVLGYMTRRRSKNSPSTSGRGRLRAELVAGRRGEAYRRRNETKRMAVGEWAMRAPSLQQLPPRRRLSCWGPAPAAHNNGRGPALVMLEGRKGSPLKY